MGCQLSFVISFVPAAGWEKCKNNKPLADRSSENIGKVFSLGMGSKSAVVATTVASVGGGRHQYTARK